METWEMIKEWYESDMKKEFRCLNPCHGQIEKVVKNCNGQLCWNGSIHTPFLISDDKHNWELVPEPVDFMTAINSEKNIRYENWVRYYRLGSAFEIMVGKSPVILREMLNGKWFVE